MAGRKQHHIPQSVLRAFKIPRGGRSDQVWVFSKPKIYTASTKDAAAERHFYSELQSDGTKTLDEIITDYESRFFRLLTDLRAAAPGTTVDARSAAEVIAHLTIRNSHLRKSFSGGMQQLLDQAVDLLCNASSLRSLLGVDAGELPPRIKTLVDEEISKDPRFSQTGLPREILHKVAFISMRENFNRMAIEQLPFMQIAMNEVAAQAPAFVRRGHNEALSKTAPSPDGRTELLAALNWRVFELPDGRFILPDCVALGTEDGGTPQALIMSDLKLVAHVFMPLAPHRILLGSRPGEDAPDLTNFNTYAAAASDTFFISHTRNSELDALVGSVGTLSRLTMDQAIAAAFDEFHTEHPTLSADVDNDSDKVTRAENSAAQEPGEDTSAPLNFGVFFVGLSDRDTAERIAAILHGVVMELRHAMPLDRLDGFTFAQDYERALRELDLGFESPPLAPMQVGYGVSAAMTASVIRDGKPKDHIVARIGFATALLSEDDATQSFAMHAIVQQLAYVACNQIRAQSVPFTAPDRVTDDFENMLYNYVDSSWSGYFAARTSALFDPNAEIAYRELVISAIRQAQQEVPAARLAYRFDGDMDRLLSVAFPAVNAILRFSSQLVGHCDGIGRLPCDNGELDGVLNAAGLRLWMDLFQVDLGTIWDRRGRWKSVDELLRLNVHVERLLWQFGIFPWKTLEGIRMEIPLATDATNLRLRNRVYYLWQRLARWLRGLVKET